MCGIHLILDKKEQLSNKDSIRKMMRSTIYRGPDNQSDLSLSHQGSHILFGCNQLHITDSSPHSSQPFSKSDDGNVLLFNGEVYNYLDLKKKFLNDYRIISDSDTEVLYHLFERKGNQTLSRLIGMYGLCFFNKKEDKIIIARDPAGMKPLYYFENENFLVVSSEIQGILSSNLVHPEINTTAVEHYIQFRHCQFPQTFFKNIYELPPGHVWEYKIGENSHPRPFIKRNKMATMEDKSLESIDQKLTNATSRHLMGIDLPALCLSGGVDSTLLLAKIHDIQKESFPVFCTKFQPENRNSDFEYARKAAKVFNADFHFHSVDETCLERFDEFVDHLDQPIGDSGAFATMLLTEEISKYHKSALSGAGADEFFGGYNRHIFYYKYLNHPKGFNRINKLVRTLSGSMKTKTEFFRLLSKLSESIGSSPYDTYKKIVSFTRITGASDLPDWEFSESPQQNLLEALTYDRNRYLVSDILALSDKMSMKNSVELRTPYLDDELIHEVKQLNPKFILKNRRKWILKKMLKKYPNTSEIINRRKRGYGLPFDQWISLNPNNIFGFLEKPDHYLYQFVDRQLIYDLYRDHIKGRKNNVLELWNIVVLARWFERQLN